MKDTNDLVANHCLDLKILSASDQRESSAAAIGFPMRAARDSDLSIEDLRILICIGVLTDASGSCPADTQWIARHTALPEPTVVERLDVLGSRGYVLPGRQGRTATLSLVADRPIQGDHPSATVPKRRAGRVTQARLHGDLLRRRSRRPAGSIDFDDSPEPHPVVASLLDAVGAEPGGLSGFRFWLRTILDPEDVEVFTDWASRQSAAYRGLVSKFERADNEQAIESLLDQTLALVNREKAANR